MFERIEVIWFNANFLDGSHLVHENALLKFSFQLSWICLKFLFSSCLPYLFLGGDSPY